MKLLELLSSIQPVSISGQKDIEISSLTEDSRTVVKNSLFFARKGKKVSGLNHISEAIQKGASAIITEEKIFGVSIPVIFVSSIMEAQSKIADRFYHHPSSDLTIVGITGTNGKTTLTYLLESIAKEMGWRVGVIGTVNYRVPKKNSDQIEILPAPNTTPNALELQGLFHTLRERETDLVLMEVSSHALSLGRVGSVEFDGGVFTNLTQDHLDFHLSMENYFSAKSILFQMISAQPEAKRSDGVRKVNRGKFSIINVDDPYGKKMVQFSSVPVSKVGIFSEADFMAKEIQLSSSGSHFQLCSRGENIPVHLNLIGLHNVYNGCLSAAAASRLNVPLSMIATGLEKVKSIAGRLEPVNCGQDYTVLVDYAHTEDALKNVLNSLRQFAKKRILTLFGCGGDRDRSKRPLMGAVAVRLSDWVVVTSDNSRSEDPSQIALDIETGIQQTGQKNYQIILDREEAIKKILKMAKMDDMVLIAGKGHETTQIFADQTIHFDDREVVRKILCCH